MGAPKTLPADFFDKPQTNAAPDTLPADFFDKQGGDTPYVSHRITFDDGEGNQTTISDNGKRTWLDSAGDTAKELWRQLNPVAGLHGAAQAASHPIQTLVSDNQARQAVARKAEEYFKKGDYAAGVAHALYSIIPLLGPELSRSGEQFQNGEYAKGIGSSVGMGLNLAGPAALKGARIRVAPPKVAARAGASMAEEMYQSALKPNLNNGAGKIEGMVKTGLQENIPISASGVEKLGNLLDDVNRSVTAEIASRPGRTVSKFKVASRLQDPAAEFAQQVNPTKDLRNISEAGNEFLDTQPGNIPADNAQALKVGTYRQLKGKYGELGNASIEAQKALARGLKEELAQAFPELDRLNMREAKLLDLQPALERAITRIGNHQLIGIGTPIAGGAVGAITQSGKMAALAATVKAIVDNPMVKSRLAIALNKASRGGITMKTAKIRIQGYMNALGKASASADAEPQADQPNSTTTE